MINEADVIFTINSVHKAAVQLLARMKSEQEKCINIVYIESKKHIERLATKYTRISENLTLHRAMLINKLGQIAPLQESHVRHLLQEYQQYVVAQLTTFKEAEPQTDDYHFVQQSLSAHWHEIVSSNHEFHAAFYTRLLGFEVTQLFEHANSYQLPIDCVILVKLSTSFLINSDALLDLIFDQHRQKHEVETLLRSITRLPLHFVKQTSIERLMVSRDRINQQLALRQAGLQELLAATLQQFSGKTIQQEFAASYSSAEERSEYLCKAAYYYALMLYTDACQSNYFVKRMKHYEPLIKTLTQFAYFRLQNIGHHPGIQQKQDLLMALIFSQLRILCGARPLTEKNMQKVAQVLSSSLDILYWHMHQPSHSSFPTTAKSLIKYATRLHEARPYYACRTVTAYDLQKMQRLSMSKLDETMYLHWLKAKRNNTLHGELTRSLTTLVTERGLSTTELLEEYQQLQSSCANVKQDSAINELLIMIGLRKFQCRCQLEIEATPANQAIEQTTRYQDLCTFLKSLHQLVTLPQHATEDLGQGMLKMRTLLNNLFRDEPPSLQQLIDVLFDLQRLSVTRAHDCTSWFASHTCLFRQKRPLWLRSLYSMLASTDMGRADFSFKQLVENPANRPLLGVLPLSNPCAAGIRGI